MSQELPATSRIRPTAGHGHPEVYATWGGPRWIAAMRRHGYKGAFELAATVDYLFGFDATAGVVTDWMYEQLAQTYVLDKESRDFLQHANPWALQGVVERLHEAVERGLWAEPEPQLLADLQQVYLDVEGELES